jgi:hypothetical protein
MFQHLLCVLHNQPIAINDNLNHLRQSSVIAISPTIIKGKGLNCSPQAPPDFVHSTVIPGKDISFDSYVCSLAAMLPCSVTRLLVKRSFGPVLL